LIYNHVILLFDAAMRCTVGFILFHVTTAFLTIDRKSNTTSSAVYVYFIWLLLTTADLFKKQIDMIGADKVAAIVTDSPNAMNSAKKKLLVMKGYEHIINMRCMLHGFALVLTSSLGSPWAKDIVSNAQKIVTYFNASHRPLATVRDFAKSLNITTGLKTSNQTRITSTHICLQSVLANMAPLQQTVKIDKMLDLSKVNQREVKKIVEDEDFWYKLRVLCGILEPLSQIIMQVQGDNITLADVTRLVISAGMCIHTIMVLEHTFILSC
jgi:Protein of unknown function (DUF 659)